MAQDTRPATGKQETTLPYWSQALRSLREARGITQDGWAAQLGYGRATIRRWEAGQTVPSADAESALITLCAEQRLFRSFTDGPLAGVNVTPEWIGDLLATGRLNADPVSPTRPPPDVASAVPPVFYTQSGDVAIAYQVVGDGPIDIVIVPGAVSHREIEWEHPGVRDFLRDLNAIARLIVFDKRGTGMSDRVATGTMEERMDDIRAVMAAAGSSRAVLVGISEGGPLSVLFAATWPRCVSALVLYGSFSRVPAPSAEMPLQPFDHLLQTWGTPHSGFLDRFGPSAADTPSEREWWARLQRVSASPGAVRDLNRMNANLDVRGVLPAVQAPTLVLHRTGDRVTDISEGRTLARDIPGAELVELSGSDHLPFVGDVGDITSAIIGFLARLQDTPAGDQGAATAPGWATCRRPRMVPAPGYHVPGPVRARRWSSGSTAASTRWTGRTRSRRQSRLASLNGCDGATCQATPACANGHSMPPPTIAKPKKSSLPRNGRTGKRTPIRRGDRSR